MTVPGEPTLATHVVGPKPLASAVLLQQTAMIATTDGAMHQPVRRLVATSVHLNACMAWDPRRTTRKRPRSFDLSRQENTPARCARTICEPTLELHLTEVKGFFYSKAAKG